MVNVKGDVALLLGPHPQQRLLLLRLPLDGDLVHLQHRLLLVAVLQQHVPFELVPLGRLRVLVHVRLLLGHVQRRLLPLTSGGRPTS